MRGNTFPVRRILWLIINWRARRKVWAYLLPVGRHLTERLPDHILSLSLLFHFIHVIVEITSILIGLQFHSFSSANPIYVYTMKRQIYLYRHLLLLQLTKIAFCTDVEQIFSSKNRYHYISLPLKTSCYYLLVFNISIVYFRVIWH